MRSLRRQIARSFGIAVLVATNIVGCTPTSTPQPPQIQIRGILGEVHGGDPDHDSLNEAATGPNEEGWFVEEPDGHAYQLLSMPTTDLEPGDAVVVTGSEVAFDPGPFEDGLPADEFDSEADRPWQLQVKKIAPDQSSSASARSTASSLNATQINTVLVINLWWSSNPVLPDTPTVAAVDTSMKTTVNDFYMGTSTNRFGLAITSTPWLKARRNRCGRPTLLYHQAVAAARRAGYHPITYSHVVVRFPRADCFGNSQATLGLRRVWLNGFNPGTAVHEIGHNLKLQHSLGLECGSGVVTSMTPVRNPSHGEDNRSGNYGTRRTDCPEATAYGDPFDIMGSGSIGSGGFNAASLKSLGWLEESEVLSNPAPSKYRLAPLSRTGSGWARAIRFDRGSIEVWLEYRTQSEAIHDATFPTPLWTVSGTAAGVLDSSPGQVLLHVRNSGRKRRTWLVDRNPLFPQTVDASYVPTAFESEDWSYLDAYLVPCIATPLPGGGSVFLANGSSSALGVTVVVSAESQPISTCTQ
ncbi:MAG TPA: hypothetical protein DEG43_10750 [Acidimicrobiaceae bacterium]|nr:hypothetical protein [Acidimicrobiaceae bacterium]